MTVWPMQFRYEGKLVFEANDEAEFNRRVDEFEFSQVWEGIREKLLEEMNEDGLEGFRQFVAERLPKRPADLGVERFTMLALAYRGHRYHDPNKPKNRRKAASWKVWKEEMESRFEAPGHDRESLMAEWEARTEAELRSQVA